MSSNNFNLFLAEFYKEELVPDDFLQCFLKYVDNKSTIIHLNPEKIYEFDYQDKKINFSLLSNEPLLPYDRHLLKERNTRLAASVFRSLRIATTNKLLDQKLLLTYIPIIGLIPIVEYKKGTTTKIIDYANNLIMDKETYFSLFKPQIINSIDKYTLYQIFSFITGIEQHISPLIYLLASSELIADLSKNYPEFKEKYDKDGFNAKNSLLLGEYYESLYKTFFDEEENKMDTIISEFTITKQLSRQIGKEDKKYYYQATPFSKKNYFYLLSDFIKDEKIKQELLSEERKNKCHQNSIMLMYNLPFNKFLVSGKQKYNTADEFIDHTWLEVKYNEQEFVVDYNRNLIMPKKDYYEMLTAQVRNKVSFDTLRTLHQYELDSDIIFNNVLFELTFSEEIIKCFEKNKSLIKK